MTDYGWAGNRTRCMGDGRDGRCWRWLRPPQPVLPLCDLHTDTAPPYKWQIKRANEKRQIARYKARVDPGPPFDLDISG